MLENITEIYGENSDTYELDILSELYKLTALLIHEYNRGGAVTHTAEYSRIKPVIDYINENYNKKIYVSDLSKILHVCDDHTIRLFKSVTNKTPLRYITDVRIEEAMKLLINSSLPVSEISDRVGFSNANYMSQIFKLTLNMTPREYRKMIK